MIKKLIVCTIYIFLHFNIFSHTTPSGFYSYKLENGLELYVQEDFTVPSMSIEYISKAGTGRQSEQTTGFFELYSRLFWKNAVTGKVSYEMIGAGEYTAQNGFSQSRYSFVLPASQFDTGMSLFSNDLQNTRFKDADIQAEYNLLKQEVSTWASSIPGFINASVDAKIFSEAPWTKDSGVYPALFNSYSLEEIRYQLAVITDTWYVPDQSALFITGPLTSSTILSIVSKYLSSWESSYSIGNDSIAQKSKSAVYNQDEKNQQLYVLVSSDFSKDYIQSVIQYTSQGLGASNTFSATSWTAAEIMQKKLLEAGMTNTDTSFIADASDSRIIIQTLFDAQSLNDDTDISLMVPGFANIVKSTAQLFNERDLQEAKNRATLFRNDAYTTSANFIEAVAANWAYGGIEYFFEWPEAVQNVTLDEVKQSYNKPWIFVLVHTDIYAKNQERFRSFGYEEITKNSAFWYTTAENHSNNVMQIEPVLPEGAILEYSNFTKSLMKEYTLTSGIPVVTQHIPSTPWSSLLVTIEGGSIIHGKLKRGTEDIAIINLKNVIDRKLSDSYFLGEIKTVPIIDNNTDIYSSYINVVCLSEDLPSIMRIVSNTIRESSISIANADELFISSAYNWRLESGSLEYQLYAAAMETLYGGTEAEGLFNANTELLLQADFKDIKLATELIYDPNRISLVITGNISNTLEADAEKYFGKEGFYPIEKEYRVSLVEEQKPIFSPFEQIVRLRHTFLTDVPASLAGDRPTKLIPTTDFSDPAQLYFEVPSFDYKEQALFNALLYEVADRVTNDFQSKKNPSALSVSVVPGKGTYPVSSLRFSKVKSRVSLKNLIENTFEAIVNELSQKDNQKLLVTIKSRYTRIISRDMQTLSDRGHLIQQGILESNNPSRYLELYGVVETADHEALLNVFNRFLDDGEFFWLFSADTNR